MGGTALCSNDKMTFGWISLTLAPLGCIAARLALDIEAAVRRINSRTGIIGIVTSTIISGINLIAELLNQYPGRKFKQRLRLSGFDFRQVVARDI